MLESQLPFRVVVHNDEEHSYEYVIDAFVKEIGLPRRGAIELAHEIDTTGRVSIPVADLPAAQALQERLFGYGPDPRLPGSRGSLAVSIEERSGDASRLVSCGRVLPLRGYERIEPAELARVHAASATAGPPLRLPWTARVACGAAELEATPAWFFALFGVLAFVIFTGSMLILALATHP